MRNKFIAGIEERVIARSVSEISRSYSTIASTQHLRAVFPGQVLTYNRTSDGYTDPKLYPDHCVISTPFYSKLIEQIPELKDYSFKLFRTAGLNSNTYITTLINSETKEILLSKDLLEFLRFGKRDYKGQGEELVELAILTNLLKSTDSTIRNGASRMLKNIDDNQEKRRTLNRIVSLYTSHLAFNDQQKKEIKAEGITVNVKAGAFEDNLLKLSLALAGARERNTNLVIFPELIVSSYQVLDSVEYSQFLAKQMSVVQNLNKQQRYYFKEDITAWLSQQLQLYDIDNTRAIMSEFAKALDDIDAGDLATDSWHDETKQPPLKQERLSFALQQILERHNLEPCSEIIRRLENNYDAFGMASIIPVAIASNDKPFNAAFCFRGDGSLGMQVHKQRLADDPSSYFYEKHIFSPGDHNRKHVFLWRGQKIGVYICEDMWQESNQKVAAKLMDSQGGIILDKRLEGTLNSAADILINTSASPEQVGYLIPHKLNPENFRNLRPGTAIIENMAFTLENPRTDTREDLIRTVSEQYGVPLLYINSLGGLDHILMAGASYLTNGKGEFVGTSEQYKNSILSFSFSKKGEISVDQVNQDYLIKGPEEQAVRNLILSVADYWEKNNIRFAAFNNDGTVQGDFLQRILGEAQNLHHQHLVEKLYRQAQVAWPDKTPQDIKKLVGKQALEQAVIIKTFIMPAMNHRFFNVLFKGLWNAFSNKTEVQVSIMFKPEWFLSGMNLTFLAAIGLSNIATHITGNYVVWPFINTLLKIAGIQGKSYKNQGEMLPDQVTNPTVFRETLSPEVINELKTELHKSIPDKGQRKKIDRLIDIWVELVGHVENLFFNNISALRSYLVTREMDRRDAKGQYAVNIGSLTEDKKNRGNFTPGGIEASGFAPLQSISSATVKLLYLYTIKQDLSQSLSGVSDFALSRKLRRTISDLSNTRDDFSFLRNIFSLNRIDKTGMLLYELSIWKDIRALSSDPHRQEALDKKINKLEKILGSKEATVKAMKKPLKIGGLEFKFMPMRLNKVAPSSMNALLDRYLTTKNLEQFTVMKEFLDPENLFNWEEYAQYIAYHILRYEKTKHKNQGINGPIFNIKTPGSHRETVSLERSRREEIVLTILEQSKVYERKALRDSAHLEQTIEMFDDIAVIKEDRNQWLDRDYEQHRIEEELTRLSEQARKHGHYPAVIIDGLNSLTDVIAFNATKKRGLKTIVLTSTEELKDLKIPGNIANLDYIYVFDSNTEKEEYLQTLMGTPKAHEIKYH
ncbi:MAG: hypothetical protein DKM50_00815 [Candidatus Margulisiibacteriota bacterium]|nr:MAG: hypothetical protein A2X43_05290 [Candidatus Margulisbacteria bacterium GWD2_39_127]OGI01476.1 MAG: hypothetical protein A2X42_11895 [Candidatus Margulisbacteria bacterium GWF2_38_17]OGI10819.1 MAG: hypothetical protein A2X41_10120 [Candidatus Margulisbacteria bacterium GWE2_39_32]PZM83957.1 MAG: hypothetical protein DKM50_00815 [Candidatus Margulisiibacteriota bacterium]HAR64455.1 hypothetical protein [Candidatus Margulisiibacteriota bacterium]